MRGTKRLRGEAPPPSPDGRASSSRSTARTVSWLTPNSAAKSRKLRPCATARTRASWSGVSLRGRGVWYDGRPVRPAGRRTGMSAKRMAPGGRMHPRNRSPSNPRSQPWQRSVDWPPRLGSPISAIPPRDAGQRLVSERPGWSCALGGRPVLGLGRSEQACQFHGQPEEHSLSIIGR